MYNNIKDILKDSIKNPNKYSWSLQGFGMFRLYLSKEVRLHVWDSRFSWDTTTLHTHPWNFESHVLSGVIVDRTMVEWEKTWGPHEEYNPYEKQQIVCGPGGGTNGESDQVKLIFYQNNVYSAGHKYTRKHTDIHESVAKPGTVTLVTRQFLEDTEHAYVYFPYNQKWKSAEPRQAIQSEIESMASLALARWNEL